MMRFLGLIVGFVLVILFLSFNLQVSQIHGESMSPSIVSGHLALFRKEYLFQLEPQRGDILIYSKPGSSGVDFIGRVVGMPLESVWVGEDGKVYIDNNDGNKYELIEEYLPSESRNKTEATPEKEWVKIGSYSYLVLPDNRARQTVDLKSNIVPKGTVKGILLKAF